MYTEKQEVPESGLAYGVVFQLMDDLLESGQELNCDNFYTSPHLFEDLHEHGIFASRTVRNNRKEFPSSLVQHCLARNESIIGYLQLENGFIRERYMFFLHSIEMKLRMCLGIDNMVSPKPFQNQIISKGLQ